MSGYEIIEAARREIMGTPRTGTVKSRSKATLSYFAALPKAHSHAPGYQKSGGGFRRVMASR